MPVERLLPTPEAEELLDPRARDRHGEARAARVSGRSGRPAFPRDVFRCSADAGLMSLPFDEEYGGGGQPYEVYLQVLEEIARPG